MKCINRENNAYCTEINLFLIPANIYENLLFIIFPTDLNVKGIRIGSESGGKSYIYNFPTDVNVKGIRI